MANEFDEELKSRLLAFQRAHGLADDGMAGAKTWHKLVEGAYSKQEPAALLGQNVASEITSMAGHEQVAPDERSDAEIARDLERRTHKSINELTLGLGLGMIQITPRELEARLIANHTLRPELPDNSKHTVIDSVTERHQYMDGRFVTRGVVGRPDVVERMKAAGEEEHAAQLQQNLASLAHGMGDVRLPAKSPAGSKPNTPKPPTPRVNKGLDKVDQQGLGTGKPANDHTNVVPIRPPAEQEPHGEIMLDTGTDAARTRNASRTKTGRSGGGDDDGARGGRGRSRREPRNPEDGAEESSARERRQAEREKDQRKPNRPNEQPVGEALRETYPTLSDALPGIPGPIREVQRVRTDKEGLRLQGFTETVYVADGNGRQWTVYHNPSTGRFGGRHPSSSN